MSMFNALQTELHVKVIKKS